MISSHTFGACDYLSMLIDVSIRAPELPIHFNSRKQRPLVRHRLDIDWTRKCRIDICCRSESLFLICYLENASLVCRSVCISTTELKAHSYEIPHYRFIGNSTYDHKKSSWDDMSYGISLETTHEGFLWNFVWSHCGKFHLNEPSAPSCISPPVSLAICGFFYWGS